MESFTFFDIYDYAILLIIILLAIFLLYVLIKRTRTIISLEKTQNLLKLSKINIGIGLALLTASILLFLYLETSYKQVWEFLRPISIMTSQPFVVLSFALFCFGFIMLIIGIYRNRVGRKSENIG